MTLDKHHLLYLLGAEACKLINHTCSGYYALSKMFYPGVNGSEFGQENVYLQFFKLPSPTFGLSSFFLLENLFVFIYLSTFEAVFFSLAKAGLEHTG